LSFLILVLLTLLAVTLLRSDPGVSQKDQAQITGWLAMAAAACFLFVSANVLTLIYAVLAFDIFAAFYWLGRGQRDWAVGQLFQGVFTASGLMLAMLAPASGITPGPLLLGLALWLRLGLYPFLTVRAQVEWPDDEWLAYQTISFIVVIYLAIRMISDPLPELIRWLAALTMLLNGLLAWLTDSPVTHPDEGLINEGLINEGLRNEAWKSVRPNNNRVGPSLLAWFILTEVLLILVVEPLAIGVALTFAFGLILSFIALWVTPALGRPRLSERAWSWPYLPAVMATLTLVGLPLLLGWLARGAIYQSLLQSGSFPLIFALIIAESLAFSSLARYWLMLLGGSEVNSRRSVVGIVMMVPFLSPGLGPLILSTITETNLSASHIEAPARIVFITLFMIIAAACLGYFRNQITNQLKIPVKTLVGLLYLNWLLGWGQILLGWIGVSILRIRVILEGQHYMGWALFIALIGALIILLS
jgi:hypothetical protein